MDKRAVKRRVISEASNESLSYHNVDAAINVNVSQGKTQEKHVEECVFLALSYEIESASEKEDEVELKHYFPPHVFPTSQGELLVKQVESWIESIRRELFGKDQPPFKSYPDAVRWMKQEAKKRPKPSKKDQKRVQELETEIIDKQKKRNRLTRQSGMSICWEALSIPYVDFPVRPDSWVEIMPVSFDKPLGPLAIDSKKISETTGFRQVEVVAWILSAERPVIPGARLYIPVSPTWTLTPAGEIFTRQARIDIFSPDLKPSEIVELYKKAQDYLRPFHLSARNRALLEIMAVS